MQDHYEKIFDIVVNRGEERLRRKKIIMSRCTRAAFSVAGLCAALIVGFGIWHNNDINHLISRDADNSGLISETSTENFTTTIVASEDTSGTVAPKVTTVVTTQTQTVTYVPHSTSAVYSSETPSIIITTAASSPPQVTSITQTSPAEPPAGTTSAAVISDVRIYHPDIETISSKFSEIRLDDGVVYRLRYTGIDASVVRAKKGAAEFTSDDMNDNKRYIVDAEIYDVSVESIENMIAVRYEGSDEIYLYYAVTDDVFSMDWVNFNVPFGKYGAGYVSCGIQRVDEEKIGNYLENISLNGKNDFTGEDILLTGKVYKINNISSDCAVAVKYDSDNEYHLFRNIIYRPDTLGQLINDMDLRNEMIINSVYLNGSYYKTDPIKVWEYLLSDEAAENCGHGIAPHDQSVSIDLPALGRRNVAINVYSDGYISTNIADSGAKFYIGTANAQAFIDYVGQYGIPVEGNDSGIPAESPLE
ncbi:MAG TPA: hypothetical protein P5191_16615 [Ruminococcus sp.]|nr:hypothetical protein [Ruminococcus sp.]